MGKNDSLPPGWGAKNKTPQGWGAGNFTPQGWANKADEQSGKSTDTESETSRTVPVSETPVESSSDDLGDNSIGQRDETPADAAALVADNPTESDSIQVLPQTPAVADDDIVNSGSQKNKKQGRNHKVTIITLTVVIVLIISLSVGAFFYFSGKKEGDENTDSDLKFNSTAQNVVYIPNTSDETFESESNNDLQGATSDIVTSSEPTESDSEETTQYVPPDTTVSEPFESDTGTEPDITTDEPIIFEPDKYIGYWHMGDSTERELSIYGANDGEIEFSLWYYRLTSIDGAVAYINGNVATFSYDYPGEDKVEGTLTFNDSSVTVTITASDNIYMPVETMVFDSTHNSSWEFGGYDYEYDDPDFESETDHETDAPPENEEPQSQFGTVVVNGVTF